MKYVSICSALTDSNCGWTVSRKAVLPLECMDCCACERLHLLRSCSTKSMNICSALMGSTCGSIISPFLGGGVASSSGTYPQCIGFHCNCRLKLEIQEQTVESAATSYPHCSASYDLSGLRHALFMAHCLAHRCSVLNLTANAQPGRLGRVATARVHGVNSSPKHRHTCNTQQTADVRLRLQD